VQLETRSGLVSRGRIINVSISGAFVETPLPAPLFSYVQVHFTGMSHGKRTQMAVEAQVVRRDDSGFGVEWSEFAPEAIRALVMVPPFRMTEPPEQHAEWDSHPHTQHRHARTH